MTQAAFFILLVSFAVSHFAYSQGTDVPKDALSPKYENKEKKSSQEWLGGTADIQPEASDAAGEKSTPVKIPELKIVPVEPLTPKSSTPKHTLGSVTLEKALEYAQTQGVSVELATSVLQENDHALSRAWSGFSPRADMQSSLSSDGSALSLGITQTLYDGGRTRAQIELNEKRHNTLTQQLALTKQQLRLQVIREFYRALYAEEKLAYQRGFLSAISNFVEYSKSVYKSRTIPKSDFLRVKLEQQNAIEAVKNAEQDHYASIETLKNTLRWPAGMPLELSGDLRITEESKENPRVIEEEILAKSLSLKTIENELLELDSSEGVALSNYWPQLSLRGSYNTEVGSPESSFLRDNGFEVAVRFSIPLFNGFATNAISREFSEQKTRATIRKKQTQESLSTDVRIAMRNLQYLRERISYLKNALGDAQEIWQLLNSQYRFQENSILRWVDSLRELTRLELSRMETVQTYLIESARLKELRG